MCNIIEGCNQPNYHYNPLIIPLMNFHGTVVTLGDQLPKEGKVAEVVQRIGLAVLSPFIYLALAFAALAGLILNVIWEKKHLSELNRKNQEGTAQIGLEIGISGTQKTEIYKASQIQADTFGNVFGRELWEKHWGSINEIAPLPKEAFEPSPINKDNPMIHDFEFFWMAPEVDGENLDVNCIEKKATSDKFGEHKLVDNDFYEHIRTDPKINEPLKTGYWFAVPKNLPIKETVKKNLQQQKDYIEQNYPKGGFGLLRTREAMVYCLMHLARDGVCDLGRFPWMLTRCEDKINDLPVIVGAAAHAKFSVSIEDDCAIDFVCGLPVRRFC